MKPIQLCAAILEADLANIEREVRRAEAAGVGSLHVDVADGHFVPSFGFGKEMVAALRRITQLPIAVHLLVRQPDRYARMFVEAGADLLIWHLEAPHQPLKTLELIRGMGCRSGLALHPLTLLSKAFRFLGALDQLLILTSHPGPHADSFLPETLEKVRQARLYRETHNLRFEIAAEGGVQEDNLSSLAQAGADVVILGKSLFGSHDPVEAARRLVVRGAEALAAG
jgi:ribulose-phosphate 3-epimerase